MAALAACSTIPKTEPAALPVALQQMFGACHGRDGSARFTVETAEGIIQADAEWLSPAGGNWDLELTNPLGQTLLILRYKKDGDLQVSGRVADRVPPLGLDKQGFLTMDGHFLGIRPEELSCFFDYTFPSAWLDRTYDYKREGDALHFMSFDKNRGIRVEAKNISRSAEREICARISWSEYLGTIERAGNLCFRGGKVRSAQLQGLDGLDIHWRTTAEDGHES